MYSVTAVHILTSIEETVKEVPSFTHRTIVKTFKKSEHISIWKETSPPTTEELEHWPKFG